MERNPKENNTDGMPPSFFNAISQYIEPTLIVTLITASLYFIGYGYYDSFFGRLSLPHKGLNLPAIFYFQELWWVWLFGVLIISISFIGAKETPKSLSQ